MANKFVTLFPYPHWSDAAEQGWEKNIISWFEDNYTRNPQPDMARETISVLLDHIFEITRNSLNSDTYTRAIKRLGKELQNSPALQSAAGKDHPHHKRIAYLLEMGLQSRHSHLFMLPEITKDNLLNRPDYSTLLLAAKFHAAGEYENARTNALEVAKGCSLALYILGQSERKLGLYEQANIHLTQGIALLEKRKCMCPFGEGATPICNQNLLKAVNLRAKAVVLRNQNKPIEAEECYLASESAAEEAIDTANHEVIDSHRKAFDSIWIENVDQDNDRVIVDVVADIHFSHGYYWYQRKKYDQAERLFKRAINALERVDEQWDSPYTRLAIVKFCKGEWKESIDLFTKAYTICNETTADTNREAPLSLALCTLGLKLIESTYGIGPLTTNNTINDLRKALELEPKLALGPLECHYNDAIHFLEIPLPENAKELVQEFRSHILAKIHEIQPSFIDSIKTDKVIKILFLAANPTDTTRIRVDEESNIIDQSLRASDFRDKFSIIFHFAVSADQIQEVLLRHKPDIVHFSGHGSSSSEIIFDNGHGQSEYVRPEVLSRTFSLLKKNIKCVVLNACFTELQAQAIAENIDCVIGMSNTISDQSAISFARAFYRAIGYGENLQTAFELGSNEIELRNLSEQDKPKILSFRNDPSNIYLA